MIWQKKWEDSDQSKLPATAISAVNQCPECIFPNLFVFLSVLAMISVSTCEPERMFSKLERTLSAIRASMTEERMESLLILQAHREDRPDTNEVIHRFAQKKRNVQFVL